VNNDVVLSNGVAFGIVAAMTHAIDEIELLAGTDVAHLPVVQELEDWSIRLLDAAYGVEGGRIDDDPF
jgi:hypothetical protein